jgi:hypothetical protein
MADSSNVYSLNVVGYVNQVVQANHWYLFGNPLAASASDSGSVLTNLSPVSAFGNQSDPQTAGSIVYCYNQPGGLSGGYGNPDAFYYDPADSYIGWVEQGNVDLTPGNGFWFYSTGTGTITFLGQVITNNSFTLIPGWNMVASAFPIQTNLTALGLIGSGPVSQDPVGDLIYRWNLVSGGYGNGFDGGIQYWNDPLDSYVGWVSSDNGDTSGIEGSVLNVGEGIWYKKTGSQVTWTQNFTIP